MYLNGIVSIRQRGNQADTTMKILPPEQYVPPQILRQRYWDGITVILAQERPKIRSILWNIDGKTRRVHLAFPYVISVATFYGGAFNNLLLFYRSYPLLKPNDYIDYPNLPNVHPSGVVCLGRSEAVAVLRRKLFVYSRAWQIRKILTYFWTESVFNSDLLEYHFLPWGDIYPQIATVENWQTSTRRDPPFILRINWNQRRAGRATEIMEKAAYL